MRTPAALPVAMHRIPRERQISAPVADTQIVLEQHVTSSPCNRVENLGRGRLRVTEDDDVVFAERREIQIDEGGRFDGPRAHVERRSVRELGATRMTILRGPVRENELIDEKQNLGHAR